MVKFTSSLYERLLTDLHQIRTQYPNILQLSEQSYILIQKSIKELKAFVLEYQFKDQQEEIHFFKEIKPKFLSESLYQSEVYNIEALKPVGGNDMIRSYYSAAMERIRMYFTRNQILYNYYQADKVLYDDFFFVRDTNNEFNATDNSVEIDHRFCTVYSYRLSKLMAFERVNEYLNQCIYKLNHPELTLANGTERKFANQWTDTVNGLIELIRALHARGSVNHGKGSINQIIEDFEILFNINLGNHYRSYQNMRIRKKSTTPFLDGLRDSLRNEMEENL